MAKAGVHLYDDGDRVSLWCHVNGETHTINFENGADNDDIAAAVLMLRERERQEAKFPGQRLASVASVDELHACYTAGVPHEEEAKGNIADLIACGLRPTWADVLVEEVSEAICALARGETEHGIEELTQVAAVAVRWIGALRRGETL